MNEPILCYVLMNMMLGEASMINSLPRISVKRSLNAPHMLTVNLYGGYSMS
jgi:hypothetical protein